MPASPSELAAVCADLAGRDERLGALIEAVGPCDLRRGRPRRTHFAELVRAVCYQQLAGAAASTIHGRLVEALGGGVTADALLTLTDADMRAAGVSANKAASMRDLARRVADGRLRLDLIARRSDDAVVASLTEVRGIGRWTAEMFLIFSLQRLDVWPTGDLGVRAGHARIFGLDEPLTPRALEPEGDPYRPYRSVLAWYCWRAVDLVRSRGDGARGGGRSGRREGG